VKITETRQAILDTLGYWAGTPLKTIIAEVDLPVGTIRGNLRDMRKAGLVDRSSQGWYRPTAAIADLY
jgi:DNA-binding IclR family transcriptional regulator